jgi:hypothetical protein
VAEASFGTVEATPSGVRAWLAEDDPLLPGLRAVLRASEVGDGVPAPGRWHTRLIKYRPGRRCVVRFDAVDGAAEPVFGKLFAAGVEEQYGVLAALGAAARDVRVVPPAGCWPELGLLVQPAVRPGTPLAAVGLAGTAQAAAWMRRAGGAVGRLHRVRWRPRRRARLSADVGRLEGFGPLFDHLVPQHAARFAAALARLRAAAGALDDATVVTSHGALRARQLLVEGEDRLALVDLDTCCLAHPARDLANLLAYVDWHAVRHPDQRDAAARAASAFLEGYAATAPTPDPAALQLFRAASLLKIAGRRLRRVEVDAWPLLPRLLGLAERAATPG